LDVLRRRPLPVEDSQFWPLCGISRAGTHPTVKHVLEMDVTRDGSPEEAVEQALRIAGRIDVVINNAGIAALGVTEAYTVDEWQQVFNVNLFGVVRVNRAVLPIIRRQRSGLLIHVSSGAGRIVVPYFGVYCASKYALEAVADSYRFELLPFGIDSVIVEPGIHRTPILDKFLEPADHTRLAAYTSTAEYVSQVKAVFTDASRNPETPGPEPVVEAFIRFIETAFGQTIPNCADCRAPTACRTFEYCVGRVAAESPSCIQCPGTR
jgi:NAD(P)-dependent dehydrogenase (short-subunit alcohol dehydrogenase family)